MPGDISRDFATSLSKLHADVEMLKKSNKQLLDTVDNLVTRIEKSEQQKDRNQRQRILRAAFAEDKAEIDQLKPHTTDTTEAEILRMFTPPPPMEMPQFQVNQELLKNMQGVQPVEMEQEKPVHYVSTDAYMEESKRLMLEDMARKQRQAQQAAEVRAQQAHKEKLNALGRLSPLWDF